MENSTPADEDASLAASSTSHLPKPHSSDTTNPTFNQEKQEDDLLLQTHIVPPSHILPDGRYIHLPPPTEAESSSFFERAVASHHLISTEDAFQTSKEKKKKENNKPYVHPLASASARLREKGIDELSKAINLGGLVSGGEYFGLTNVVNRPSTAVAPKKKEDEETTNNSEGKNNESHPDNESSSLLTDKKLRSSYALKRYRGQYEDASTVLATRSKRLLTSLSGRRVLDARLRNLRQRWRLCAPERKPGGMVRARDVVAVDVEVYDGNNAGDAAGGGHTLGRIARRVPRFATVELEKDYNVSTDVNLLREEVQRVWRGLKGGSNNKKSVEKTNGHDEPLAMEVDGGDTPKQQFKTKAEPFATADPTLGQIDPDFDPDKVPLLTLLFEIEKPSTGFVQRATLSSSFASENNRKEHILPPDERVIGSLQHSLFCASLFESMRAEIIPPPTQSSATHTQQRNESVAWLSSEMEESFLPPPSMMAGRDNCYTGELRLLCVVHCHEGEVKVQLDDEYCLTAKLIEVGKSVGVATSTITDSSTVLSNDEIINQSNSGSESPVRLQALCKALLLHSQSLYHEHRMKIEMDEQGDNRETAKPVGLARIIKEKKKHSPHILQSCVGLGCKLIFENKIRAALKVSFGAYISSQRKPLDLTFPPMFAQAHLQLARE